MKKPSARYSKLILALGVLVPFLAVSGCGSSSGANVISVAVSPSSTTVIVSQSVTLTATVSGTTNLNVTWACTYATTNVDSSGKSTTGGSQACNSSTGNIPANSSAVTVVFTAPSQVPNLDSLTGSNCTSSSTACSLAITITATSVAQTKKTGTATITIDSGIAVSVTPASATVPTNEQQGFFATLSNDLQTGGGVTWLITQGTPTTSLPYPSLPTCSPGCGSLTPVSGSKTAVTYTAPGTVPSTATLTLVATSNADNTRFTVASITIIQGGPITFKGISPTIAPQGGVFYDIFLDAPLISSSSVVTIVGKNTGTKIVPNAASGQFKVVFPAPTASVATPASTGARIRLTSADLATADTYTVTLTDPAETVTACTGSPLPSGCSVAGAFSFEVVPVRPTSVATLPDSIIQNGSGNDLDVFVDGGYFGDKGSLPRTTFNGSTLTLNNDIPSNARQLSLLLSSSVVNSSQPGLYPLSVGSTTLPQTNPSVTNMAVFPDYSHNMPPNVLPGSFSAGTGPSAADIDTRLGILAVAETGSNLVQFFSIGTGTLMPLSCPTTSCTVNVPTGLSINQTNHTVAVVSAQDQSVVVLPLPGSNGAPGVTYPLTISLAGLVPSAVSPLPFPYSIGVDSDTNNAIVAYSSQANPTTAKVGFLLDLNADSTPCIVVNGLALPKTAPCVHAQVTLNTGPYPQIAMVPHSHLGLVTPGGIGVINGVDVTAPTSTSFAITNVSVNSGLVTVTVTVPSGQTLGLNPGNPGTVLIEGVPNGAHGTVFNGAFTILSVASNNSFTYALSTPVNDTSTGAAGSFAYFGAQNITLGISQTAQGISINPITRTAALADANATGNNGAQIDLLNNLDQTATAITFHAGCTAVQTQVPCSGAPELLGTSSVAFQPYTNALVSYNPQLNQVSISDPVTLQRYAFACNQGANPSCLTDPTSSPADQMEFQAETVLPNGSGAGASTVNVNGMSVKLFGDVVVDAATNQAFVVQSGTGQIVIVNLGNLAAGVSPAIKPAEITELQVPTVAGALIGGIKGARMPQGTLTCVNTANPAACNLSGVQIFGAGFDSSTQVQLDGTAIPQGNVHFVNSRNLQVTIPGSFLSMPHRYAVSVVTSTGVQSNVTDFFVLMAVDMTATCPGSTPSPSSVAIADQLPGQSFSPIAVVTNSGCNNIAVVDINPQSATFGAVKFTVATGTLPYGVAVSQKYGLAVVANNSDGTASVLDLIARTQKIAAVTTGTSPTGVAINDETGIALVTNTGSNTASELNLSLLFGSSAATSLTPTSIATDNSPIAVAIDPDRGTNQGGLAVVSALELISGSAPEGVLDAIDLGTVAPAKSTTAATGTVTATPTGVVFDESVFPALFYATSSGGNIITTFNPDSGGSSSVHVGINPLALALNPQTGGIITTNAISQTISIVDTNSNPFKTRSTFGISGSLQFGVGVDQFTNLAVIADQASNRVLIFPMPN